MATAAARLPSPTAPSVPKAPAVPLGKLFGFFLMCFGMFMAILDIQIVAASLREVQAGLSASSDEIVWVQSSYLIAEIIMIPLSGFLSRALSTRYLFVLSSLGFTLCSALCSTANSIETMILYRALQGFLGGAMIPTVFATSYLLFGRNRQVLVMVCVSLIVTLAPTVGPVLGGWITEYFSWHWLFLVNIVPGIIVTFGVLSLMDVDLPDFALLKRIDIPGLLLMAIFLGGVEYILEEGPRKHWFDESVIRTWFLITVGAGILFAVRLATAKEPIVRLAPFRNYNFAAGCFLGALGGIGLYGLTYVYPLYLGQVAHLSSGQIGNILFVSGLCMVLSSPIAGLAARRFDPRLVSSVGFLMLALSTWLSHGLTDQWRFDQFLLPQILRGVGLMVCMVSVNATAFATLPAEALKDASGLFTLLRNLGGATGLAWINSVILWRTNFHWTRAIEHVSLSRPEVADRLDSMAARLDGLGMQGDTTVIAARQMGQMILQQVQVMAFSDSFYALCVMFLVGACLPPLLRKPQPTMPPPEAH